MKEPEDLESVFEVTLDGVGNVKAWHRVRESFPNGVHVIIETQSRWLPWSQVRQTREEQPSE